MLTEPCLIKVDMGHGEVTQYEVKKRTMAAELQVHIQEAGRMIEGGTIFHGG